MSEGEVFHDLQLTTPGGEGHRPITPTVTVLSATDDTTDKSDGNDISEAGSITRSLMLPKVTKTWVPRKKKVELTLPVELQLKVKSQVCRINTIQKLLNSFPQTALDTTTVEIKSLQAQIEEIHKAFEMQHAYFEENWPVTHIDHSYFKDEFQEQEYEVIGLARKHLARLLGDFARLTSSAGLPQPAQPSNQKIRLPPIQIRNFDGQYHNWQAFQKLFTELVIHTNEISPIERLHYLRSHLNAAPLQIITKLRLSGESFQPSWQLLTDRYANKRIIIQEYVDRLLTLPKVTQCDARSLTALTSTVSECMQALMALGAPVDSWNHLTVTLVANCLDSSTREAWETTLGSSQEYPECQQLLTFITSKARALERVEASSNQPTSAQGAPTAQAARPPSAQRSSAPHYKQKPQRSTKEVPSRGVTFQATAQQGTSSSSKYPCDCCGAESCTQCRRFLEFTVGQRREIIAKRKLCINCPGDMTW